MTKTSVKQPTPDELLATNSLNHKEIILRLDYIKDLLSKGELEFDEKQLIKLEKLIEKSRYNELDEDYDRSKEIPDQIEYPKDEKIYRTAGFLSEKYLTKKEVGSLIKNIKALVGDEKSEDPKSFDTSIRSIRTSIRCSENAQHLKKIIAENTSVIKSDEEENLFILKYPDKTSKIKDHNTMFDFSVKIINDKFKIIFSKTFKENDSLKMKPEDHLFPEEIQMAMFEKLMSLYPELETRLTTTIKIDCIQENIINLNSLVRISKYFDHTSQNPEFQSEMKSILDSSPNQSNTQNFMNQLKLKFNLKIDALPPKNSVNRLINAVNIKQTFSKGRD